MSKLPHQEHFFYIGFFFGLLLWLIQEKKKKKASGLEPVTPTLILCCTPTSNVPPTRDIYRQQSPKQTGGFIYLTTFVQSKSIIHVRKQIICFKWVALRIAYWSACGRIRWCWWWKGFGTCSGDVEPLRAWQAARCGCSILIPLFSQQVFHRVEWMCGCPTPWLHREWSWFFGVALFVQPSPCSGYLI